MRRAGPPGFDGAYSFRGSSLGASHLPAPVPGYASRAHTLMSYFSGARSRIGSLLVVALLAIALLGSGGMALMQGRFVAPGGLAAAAAAAAAAKGKAPGEAMLLAEEAPAAAPDAGALDAPAPRRSRKQKPAKEAEAGAELAYEGAAPPAARLASEDEPAPAAAEPVVHVAAEGAPVANADAAVEAAAPVVDGAAAPAAPEGEPQQRKAGKKKGKKGKKAKAAAAAAAAAAQAEAEAAAAAAAQAEADAAAAAAQAEAEAAAAAAQAEAAAAAAAAQVKADEAAAVADAQQAPIPVVAAKLEEEPVPAAAEAAPAAAPEAALPPAGGKRGKGKRKGKKAAQQQPPVADAAPPAAEAAPPAAEAAPVAAAAAAEAEADAAPAAAPVSTPHGGVLVNLLVPPVRRAFLEAEVAAGRTSTWTLTPRQACDLELLMNGGFSPLRGFMDSATYASVLQHSRLVAGHPAGVVGYTPPPGTPASAATVQLPGAAEPAGLLWPMPITLDVPEALAAKLQPVAAAALADNATAALAPGSRLALRDEYHNLVAVLTVTDVYRPDKAAEAAAVLGTSDPTHPTAQHLASAAHEWYVGGVVEGIQAPHHYDYPQLRMTPQQVRAAIAARGWRRTVAFQTRNPMHRAHIELTRMAAQDADAGLLIHPVVGVTKPGDIEASVRVRCYLAVLASGRYYQFQPSAATEGSGSVMLALLHLAMRMAGPKEALWHAIIRKNHGATHFIVGRDHAGCKSEATGKDFYGPYDAQTLVRAHAAELGLTFMAYSEVEYLPDEKRYVPADKVPAGARVLSISGTKFRALMNAGAPIPPWFSDPDVIAILRQLMPPLHSRGFVIFFTGLSGGGKTTIASALLRRLASLAPTRKVTLLDGDVVRTHLSRGLGFSIADRNANIERIGWVAGEAVRHGGIVVASAIAPFAASRKAAKAHVTAAGGGFFQVFVSTRLAVCAERDVKGLYAAAAAGRTDLTAVSHPFEYPDADTNLVLQTEELSVDDAVTAIVAMLVKEGYLPPPLGAEGTEAAVVTATGPESQYTAEEAYLAAAAAAAAKAKAGAAPEVVPAPSGLAPSIAALGASRAGLAALFPPPKARDVAGAQCAPGWDELLLPSGATSYGGRPSQGTPSHASIAVPLDAATGGTTHAPANLVYALAPGPLEQEALAAALLGKSAAAGAGAAAAPGAVQDESEAMEEGEDAGEEGGSGGGSSGSGKGGRKRRARKARSLAAVGAAVVPETEPAALFYPLSGERIAFTEAAAAAATGSGAACAAGGKQLTPDAVPTLRAPAASFDAAFATGIAAALGDSDAARLWVAYDLWTGLRWVNAIPAAAGEEEDTHPPRDTTVVSHPRLLPYLPSLLRLDPCAVAVLAVPVLGSAAASASALAAALGVPRPMVEGEEAAPPPAVAAYLKAWIEEATALAAAFPTRVAVLPVGGDAAEPAALCSVFEASPVLSAASFPGLAGLCGTSSAGAA